MYVPGGKLENGPGYIEGNGRKGNGVVIKFEANINVEGCGVYSTSVGNNRFCAFVQEEAKGEKANEESCFYSPFNLDEGPVAFLRVGAQGCQYGIN